MSCGVGENTNFSDRGEWGKREHGGMWNSGRCRFISIYNSNLAFP